MCFYSLTGCTHSQATQSNGKTELTLWTFVPQHVEFYQKMAKRWNELHPDRQITLKADNFPYADMHNKLLLSLYSGVGAPDLADIEINRFPNYLKGKPQLVPLNDLIEPVKDKVILSRFEIYSKDGKYYGIDFHVGATVMYYNTEILSQAGVDPDQIKTWDDYVEAGKKVKAKTGKMMTTVEITDLWSYWPMVIQQNSDFIDRHGNVTLDNKTNIKTLQFLYDMIEKDKIAQPAPRGFHHSEDYYAFMNKGEAASVMMPMWYMGRFTDFMPDLKGKIIVRPLPAWTKGGMRSAGMGGTGTAVTNQSKHVKLAKEFLAFSKLSKEGNIEIWKTLGFDPVRWDVWDLPELNAPNKYTEYFGSDIFKTLLSIKDEIHSPHLSDKSPQMNQLLRSEVFFNTLQRRSQTPAESLKAVAEEMRR
nr:sugar ABC transporter substrate-binding protein [Paenactinomyces guangxiensis]